MWRQTQEIFSTYFGNIPWGTVVTSVVIALVAIVFSKIFSTYILRIVRRFTRRTKTDLDDKLIQALNKPLAWLIIVLGFYFAIKVYGLNPVESINLAKALRSALVIVVAAGLYRLAPTLTDISNRFRVQFDRIVRPFLTRVLRFVIVALAIAMTAEEWGFKVGGFLAGLGIGGLALALAARDSLANLFAGFVLVTERPFSIDDWIKTPTVEGTVEDITFRSTKIRTFSQALVIVPNSLLANEAITNWTKMGKRQITFRLGVSYRTTRDQLQQCVDEIRKLLQNHPETHDETIMVNFDAYGSSSLDIFLYFFTKTTVWAEFLAVKEDINFRIMEILERLGVDVAFPSQSIYFETPLQTTQSESGFDQSPVSAETAVVQPGASDSGGASNSVPVGDGDAGHASDPANVPPKV